ncbi:MAG: hypothetical protein COB66_06630 [Coxiella sp. (in: Bacteria)]|nr:MAG: hypothetical protein COB66_06630 [Coxiella sp. (in: g-proteobacteria)]
MQEGLINGVVASAGVRSNPSPVPKQADATLKAPSSQVVELPMPAKKDQHPLIDTDLTVDADTIFDDEPDILQTHIDRLTPLMKLMTPEQIRTLAIALMRLDSLELPRARIHEMLKTQVTLAELHDIKTTLSDDDGLRVIQCQLLVAQYPTIFLLRENDPHPVSRLHSHRPQQQLWLSPAGYRHALYGDGSPPDVTPATYDDVHVICNSGIYDDKPVVSIQTRLAFKDRSRLFTGGRISHGTSLFEKGANTPSITHCDGSVKFHLDGSAGLLALTLHRVRAIANTLTRRYVDPVTKKIEGLANLITMAKDKFFNDAETYENLYRELDDYRAGYLAATTAVKFNISEINSMLALYLGELLESFKTHPSTQTKPLIAHCKAWSREQGIKLRDYNTQRIFKPRPRSSTINMDAIPELEGDTLHRCSRVLT